MNIERGTLNKIYSINYLPCIVDVSDIKQFFSYNIKSKEFRINNLKKLSGDIHAFCGNMRKNKIL